MMFPFLRILYFAVISFVGAAVNADGFLGCGGFVKSEVDINYSLVEIKLYTSHGSIKYETDCAPNNGYYLIPVYDKGDFVLKVEPPSGWTFEPASFDLSIDGVNDKCSRGEDINFVFTGFSLYGQVISSGQPVGPPDIDVHIHKSGQPEALSAVRSTEHGRFSFSRLLPGDYEIRAKHPSWVFEKDVTMITIGRDNANADGSLVVRGYPVSGVVYSEQEPIKGVKFVLFAKTPPTTPITGCDSGKVVGFATNEKHSPVCHVVSSAKGNFEFPVLPTGDYIIVPFYKGEHITFDVLPDRLEFSVAHSSVTLRKAFEVAGFSVSGRVLDAVNGRGIAGAKIALNDRHQGETDAEGRYHLENMKTGVYTIQVSAKHVTFAAASVKITPNTPQLSDIVAYSFRVCGRVRIDKLPEITGQRPKRSVTMMADGSQLVTVDTDDDGSFCTNLRPGSYNVKVPVSSREAQAGLRIVPSEQRIDVINKPVSGIKFTQFKASITGSVVCLEKCGRIEISLESARAVGEKITTKVSEADKVTTFTFEDLLPGKYKVVLLNDAWCWKEKTLEADLIDRDLTGIEFLQTGYIFKCTLSHEITLHFTHEKKSGSVGSFQLNKGTNRFCLAQPGVYRLTPDSCHRFERDVYSYDTSKPATLSLTALRHYMTGIIKSDTNQSDIVVHIKSTIDPEPITIGPLVAKSVSGQTNTPVGGAGGSPHFVYEFDYWARTGDSLEISPESHKLLYYPKKITVDIKGDKCPGNVATFDTKHGVFIRSFVQPALAGVRITISSSAASSADIVLETDSNGEYSVGPLDPESQYAVSAERPGYTLEKVEGQLGAFNVFKLAEINVKVVDEGDAPLTSVLLSLSGGTNYRSNNLTLESGVMTFMSLHPGQYYLRAMMKEYRFEPSSQMIEVSEGSTTNISIRGLRVAFSCFGHVTSLNGEPEANVVVEAVGIGAGSCRNHQEESKTTAEGMFRVRGLQPDCDGYSIRVQNSSTNQHIERSTPPEISMRATRDTHDVNFITFRRTNQLDVSGNVVTPLEYLSNLKVRLFREDNADTAVHTISLATSSFFYFPSLPIDNQRCTVVLETSLPKSLYDYTLPDIKFLANVSHRHFTIHFTPKKRSVDQDFSHSSVLFLPLTVLCMLAIYNHKLLRAMAKPYTDQFLAQASNSIRQLQRRIASCPGASGGGGGGGSSDDLDTTYDLVVTKKKSKSRKT